MGLKKGITLVRYDGEPASANAVPVFFGAKPAQPRSEDLIVMIPGAETGVSFVPLAGILQPFWQVVILDSGFNEPEPFSANLQYKGLLNDFLRVARRRAVVLVGQGYGAVLATLLATDPRVRAAGVNVSRIVWLNPSWSLREPVARVLSAGLRFLRRLPANRRLTDLVEKPLVKSFLSGAIKWRYPEGVPLEWLREREKTEQRSTFERWLLPCHVLWDVIPASVVVEMIDNVALSISVLRDLPCKVDVLWGRYDPLVRSVWLRWLVGRKLGTVRTVSCGHFINLALPFAVAELIEDAVTTNRF